MSYVYLAEPIDQQKVDISSLLYLMRWHKIPFYSPLKAWNGVVPPFPAAIQRTNDEALCSAAGVLAVLPKGAVTIGVPMEIQRAIDLGIPVVVWADYPQTDSAAMAALDVRWVMHPRDAATTAKQLLSLPAADDLVGLFIFDHDENHIVSAGPQGHHDGDAGYDLTCTQTVTIEPYEVGHLPCGIAVEMPSGYWALIQGRSSAWRKGLSVKSSVIDNGYRGMLWVDCLNITQAPVRVQAGERVGQLIPMPLAPPIRWESVLMLTETTRGSDGYGSTGA